MEVGQRFGRLVVLGFHSRIANSKRKWLCRCDCGKISTVETYCLTAGKAKSCGCYRPGRRTHGLNKTTEYNIWVNIKQRCENPNNPAYDRYGGRGIFICPEWRDSFQAFYGHVGQRPSNDHSIDRIDNDKGYEPGNVRWATRSEQSSNRRSYMVSEKRYDFNGKKMTIPAIAKITNIPPSTIYKRIGNGWKPSEAFSTPPEKKFSSKMVCASS